MKRNIDNVNNVSEPEAVKDREFDTEGASDKSKGGAIINFTEGNVTKGLISFAMPLFFSNLLQAVYNIVDMIVVGQVVGANGLSAVSVGGDILTFLTFFAMGFANSGQVIIAQNIGAGRREKIGKIAGNLCLILLGLAVFLGVVCFFLRAQALGLMNTPSEVWADALSYVTVCTFGLIFIYGYNAIGAILRGMGDSRHPFMFIATAAVLNVILDIVFVVGLGMGAKGAALATVMSQGVSFIWGSAFILTHQAKLDLRINPRSFVPEKEVMGSLVRLGVPMAIKSAAISLSKMFVDAKVNAYGVIVSGVSGIESKFNQISNLFSTAVNTSANTAIGQNIGAEKFGRVPRILLSAISITVSVAAILSLALALFPKAIFGIFTSDEAVVATCMEMITLLIFLFFSSALRSPANALIDGSGNYRLNLATAFLDGIICRIGFAMLFGEVFGYGWIGFLAGDIIAGFVPTIIGGIFFISGKWRTRKYIIGDSSGN